MSIMKFLSNNTSVSFLLEEYYCYSMPLSEIMSTENLPTEIDDLSDASTVVGVDKTREEYLRLFSR